MKRKVLIIGIGAGNPDYVTIQAVSALNQVDVFFIPDKGAEKEQLSRIRREICERFITDPDYRMVDFATPVREKPSSTYRASVTDWHDKVEATYEHLLMEELGDDECGAFLVWGDPSLYDSTIRILDRLNAKGSFELEYDVIPGITSIQALTAKHKVVLNRIGESITITTGRKLAEGFPNNSESVVVMLDGEGAFKNIHEDVDIYWGAYIGTEDEILMSGKLREVVDDIERLRNVARAQKGWIMDTYLLKKTFEDVEE
ncbi:precorrin-6A synthase (deacetylating) [Phyllobacterium sp. YR531]|uniref:precorrin-6A synthase (deacetylating) n=1 Tax=Phyllobacterium sp. YR531 TaxID=1144343 RepID=UPI00026FC405|nr:precorrin-6A synthase (deacetylating) [Phyllobacterium sp. YR531]EJM99426.1 precorrin-6A synthase, deacetylating [Phyllobacterium sp. YR531]